MSTNPARRTAPPDSKEQPQAAQPIISRSDEKKVEERVAINAHVVYEAVRREGEEELLRPDAALAWSGLAAGLSMGISFIAQALLKAHIPNPAWATLISTAGYSVGFLVIVLGRQQLFTENTLTVILPLIQHPDWKTFSSVLRLWAIVLCANLLGTYLVAACLAKTALFESGVVQALTEIGQAHMTSSFGIVLIRAIFAGWLIALMVWLLPGADSSRVSIIIILTYVIGLGGFNHIVAGSTTVFYLVVKHSLTWGSYFHQFFLPTIVGNIIGGVTLVSALAHAQVVGGRDVSKGNRPAHLSAQSKKQLLST